MRLVTHAVPSKVFVRGWLTDPIRHKGKSLGLHLEKKKNLADTDMACAITHDVSCSDDAMMVSEFTGHRGMLSWVELREYVCITS